MATIHLDSLGKVYDNGFEAIRALTLDVADGEFLVLVGPSGCGKSTALRMVAGLETITAGELRLGEQRVNEVAPKNRDIAMVFQNHALYPHMTVAQNIGFPLRMAKLAKDEIAERVADVARMLELTDQLQHKPGQLSGGQQQRVAMGRAIIRRPAAFLMDEPLSNLDAKLRVQMRADIQRLQRGLGVTTIYVTHDQVEAMTMGDRVAVLDDGVLQQVDTPQVLYDRPCNTFVAAFIGSPAMNLHGARLDGDTLVLGSHRLRLPAATFEQRPGLRGYDGRSVVVGVRPEDLQDASLGRGDGDATITCDVVLTERIGSEVVVHVSLDAPRVATGARGVDTDDSGPGAAAVGRFDPRTTAEAGQPIDIAVDTTKLHFFDPESRSAIWA